jgi:hypothetical protein
MENKTKVVLLINQRKKDNQEGQGCLLNANSLPQSHTTPERY